MDSKNRALSPGTVGGEGHLHPSPATAPTAGETETHMTTHHVGVTTGQGRTDRFGFMGTDLGYLTLTNHGYVIATFGDTFESALPGGPGWRSPVMLRTSNRDLENGIRWDNAVGGSYAKQVISYRRNLNTKRNGWDDPFTVIPNDVIHLPDGQYLMSAHHVRTWARVGRASWWSFCNRLYQTRERNAEDWYASDWADLPGNGPAQFNNDHGAWRVFQNATFVLQGDYLYMFGTESGRTSGGGIYLARVPWQKWDHLFTWQFWGWTGTGWAWGTQYPTPILMPSLEGGAIGEINARIIEGVVVLSYMEYANGPSLSWSAAVTRTAPTPDAIWTAPQVHMTSDMQANPYAPAIHPYSTLDKPFMHLSQWTGGTLYGCHLYGLGALVRPGAGDGVVDVSGLPTMGLKTTAAAKFARGDLALQARIMAKAQL